MSIEVTAVDESVESLHGIGPATADTLRTMYDITTVEELAVAYLTEDATYLDVNLPTESAKFHQSIIAAGLSDDVIGVDLGGRAVEAMVFARSNGVWDNLVANPPVDYLSVTPDDIDFSHGCVVGEGCVASYVWDLPAFEDKFDVHGLDGDVSTPVVKFRNHEKSNRVVIAHCEEQTTMYTHSFLRLGLTMYGVNTVENPSCMRMNPNREYPAIIDSPDGDTMVVVAPRVTV